jgi:hypothetical protein
MYKVSGCFASAFQGSWEACVLGEKRLISEMLSKSCSATMVE